MTLIIGLGSVVVGICLIVAYSIIEKTLVNEKETSNAVRANLGLYSIGIILLTAGATLLATNADAGVLSAYLPIFTLLGIVLIVLTAIILNDVKRQDARAAAGLTLGLGLLLTIGSAGKLYWDYDGKGRMSKHLGAQSLNTEVPGESMAFGTHNFRFH